MRRSLFVVVAIIAAVATSPAFCDQAALPSSQPASKPSAVPAGSSRAEQVAGLIEAIRSASDPSSAAAAYARANAMVPTHIALHEAYLKRMLRFGLPDIALYPARVLVTLDRDHALAWAVIGYAAGKESNLADAFAAIMKAASVLRDDPSVLQNAGQLAAWYDIDRNVPKLPDSARRLLEDARADLTVKEPFARSYQRISDAFKESSAAQAEYDRKIPAAEAAIGVLRTQLGELEGQYRATANDIQVRSRLIDNMQSELTSYPIYVGTGGYYSESYYLYRRLRRDALRDCIRQEQLAVDQLNQTALRIKAVGDALKVELESKSKALSSLQAERDQAAGKPARAMRWDPPAVDGVVTADLEGQDVVWRKPEAAAVVSAEAQAAQQIRLAELYSRNNLPAKARAILNEICDKHPGTPAAKEARLILASLPPAN